MRVPAALLLVALCGSAAAQAPAVYRCEDANAKVTYSDTPCPGTARSSRKLDDAPALRIGADDAAPDTASPDKAGPGAGTIEPSRPRSDFNPIQEDEKITAQIAAQRQACEQMARRLRFLEQDLATAQPANRSSAELALRRAQDEYLTQCPRR